MESRSPTPRFHSNSFLHREMRTRKYTFLTVIGLGVGLVAFFFAYAAFGSHQQRTTLKQLHIVFRHGDRTPSFSFPNDPNGQYAWPDGFGGSLTNRGKKQLYQLGETLRSLYNVFLTDTYNASWIHVTSSITPRTQMSAMVLLAALYPPKGNQIWNTNLLWQPIPVNPIPRVQDNLIACKAPCKAFNQEKAKSDEKFISTLTSEQIDLFKKLTEYTGRTINSTSDVASLYYTLYVEKTHGLLIPDWAQILFPEIVVLAAEDLAGYVRNDVLKKFQAGPMITQWIQHMTDASKRQTPVKVYLYSGHDLTIGNLMRTLGQEPRDFLPDYGAALVVELHQTEGNVNFVRLAYFNSSSTLSPVDLQLPRCEVQCPLESFVNRMKPFLIEDWDRDCGN